MADTKISGLTALTGANTASGDLLTIVDISDTAMAATGTNKKITLTELQSAPVSAGTANGVAYLNGSKVVTTGSALTFDGANLKIGNPTYAPNTNLSGNLLQIKSSSGFSYLTMGNGDGANNNTYIGSASAITTFGTVTDAGATTELMRLTSTGLGIGTSSPGQKLEVTNAGAVSLRLRDTTTNWWDLQSNSFLAFIRGSTEMMRLDAFGNLGLGVTPSAWGSSSALQMAGGQSYSRYGITNNAYYDGGNYRYISTAAATLYGNNAGSHLWFNAASGTAGNAITFTQAMTLDASGLLTVGNTSPAGSSQITAYGASNGQIAVQNSTNWSRLLQNSSDLYIDNGVGGSAGNIIFRNSSSTIERARIDSSGNLLVGDTTSGTVRLRVTNSASDDSALFKNSNATPYGVNSVFSAASPNNTTSYFYSSADSGPTVRFKVYSNGGIANYQANNANLSDRREKTNFALAGEYLSKICAIPVQTFNYIDQNNDEDPGTTLGVVAQDVQAVAPELVMESNWGTEEEPKMRLSIYQTDLQYALMKALQELKAEFDAYKATHP